MSGSDPQPPISLDPGEPIPQWRREEIDTLPQELLNQYLLTVEARERRASATPERSLIMAPREDAYNTATTSQGSATHSMFGPNVNASCFGERERVRQMEILMAMWARGFVFRPLIAKIRF